MRGNVRRHAEYEIAHAFRQAGIGKAAHELDAGAGGLLRRLDDDCAAGGERRRDLARGGQRREIPRRERGDDAHRLLNDELADILAAAWHDAAIGAAAFLGEPIDDVGCRQHFHARLDENLALLLGHDFRDVLGALAHEIGRLAHDLGAVIGGRSAPGGKSFRGGVKRAVEIRRARMRERRQRLAGRRIDDFLALAAAAVEPFAIDIKLKFGVHDASSIAGNFSRGGEIALPTRRCYRASRLGAETKPAISRVARP